MEQSEEAHKSFVALEHALQVPAFWLRSGRVLEHQQPGGDTRKVAGRKIFWGFSARTSRGGCVLAVFFAFWEACVLRTLRSAANKHKGWKKLKSTTQGTQLTTSLCSGNTDMSRKSAYAISFASQCDPRAACKDPAKKQTLNNARTNIGSNGTAF